MNILRNKIQRLSARRSTSKSEGESTISLDSHNLLPSKLASVAGVPAIFVLVGLPARGKSYLSCKLQRYLRWRFFKTQTFNAGDKRRQLLHGGGQTADFFSKETSQRDSIAKQTFDELVEWINDGGHVAIFDATNTTVARRKLVKEWAEDAGLGRALFFIESICTDEVILDLNYKMKLKNDDYKDWEDRDAALADFKKRVEKYEKVYEPIGSGEESDDSLSYIKLFNVGTKVIVNKCHGYLSSIVVAILQNFHIKNRRLFITMPGEDEDYARRLCDFIQDERHHEDKGEDNQHKKELMVVSSPAKACVKTVKPFKDLGADDINHLHTNLLNDASSGLCEGMSEEEIKKEFPDEYKARKKNKLLHRYPGGESYIDVVNRLNPLVLDFERLTHDVLIVSHTSVIRALMGYFLATPLEKVPFIDVPVHCVFEMKPGAYKCELVVHDLYKV